jgi:hypothetical protein
MSEVTDLIAAIAAIAKDPHSWERRLGDVEDAGKQLAAARKLKKEAEDAAKAAAQDKETASYERGQAERATRDAAAQAAANAQREHQIKTYHESVVRDRDNFIAERNNAKISLDQREAELVRREQAATAKLNEASKLMASYDEAKHKAALKLAS